MVWRWAISAAAIVLIAWGLMIVSTTDEYCLLRLFSEKADLHVSQYRLTTYRLARCADLDPDVVPR